jgi:hypothetical protein
MSDNNQNTASFLNNNVGETSNNHSVPNLPVTIHQKQFNSFPQSFSNMVFKG